MFVVSEQEDRTIPVDTIIVGRLREMGLKTVEYTRDGEQKSFDHIEWWWEITGPEAYEGRKVKGSCFPELTNAPNNRFRLWVEAILGRPLAVGEGVDPDALVGLSVEMTVKHRNGSDGRIFEEVDEILGPVGGSGGRGDDDMPF